MKNKLFFFAFLSLIAWSCSKDQRVVKDLEGEWIVSSITTNGTAAPASEYAGIVYNFTNCKVKKGDCDGSVSIPDSTKGTLKQSFTYGISEKGKKITINLSVLSISETIVGDIQEHSDTKFVYSYTESGGTDKIVETLSRK
jgi:hypothetical protein